MDTIYHGKSTLTRQFYREKFECAGYGFEFVCVWEESANQILQERRREKTNKEKRLSCSEKTLKDSLFHLKLAGYCRINRWVTTLLRLSIRNR